MNETLKMTAKNIIRDAVMESCYKERNYRTCNEIASKCREQMKKHFKGTWHCHIGPAGQYGYSCYPVPETKFKGMIDGLGVVLYQTSTKDSVRFDRYSYPKYDCF